MEPSPGNIASRLIARAAHERARGTLYTLKDWLREHPPARAFTQTLAGVAGRTRRGEDFRFAVREFLDELELLTSDEQRGEAIRERPEPTGDARYDTYLGALAEHLAWQHSLDRPRWCVEPDRFLDSLWFPSAVPGFRALAVAQSPAAFRRRGIFVSRASLERV